MTKTFRINVDLEFANGQVLTVEHEARGANIAEASNHLRSDLALRLGPYVSKIHPLNFYEQIDPMPYEDEAAAECSAVAEPQLDQRMGVMPERMGAFLRDKLLEDLSILTKRLNGRLDPSRADVDHSKVACELNDAFIELWYNYQGFMNEERGTAYYEAWLVQDLGDYRAN